MKAVSQGVKQPTWRLITTNVAKAVEGNSLGDGRFRGGLRRSEVELCGEPGLSSLLLLRVSELFTYGGGWSSRCRMHKEGRSLILSMESLLRLL